MASIAKADKSAKGARAPRGTDINDLSDVLTASGIDLKEEENYLAGTYRPAGSTPTTASTFAGGNQQGIGLGILPPGGLPGSGPLSKDPVSDKTVEQELLEKHQKAAREHAARKQAHLSDPFLHPNVLRYRLDKLTKRTGIHLSADGVSEKPSDVPRAVQTAVIVSHTADPSGIVSTKANCIVDPKAPLAELITLLSLATQERIRGILEDSLSFSRGRRTGSDGVVPPDWGDLAIGSGEPKMVKVTPMTVTKSPWEHQPPAAPIRKRMCLLPV